MRDLTGVHADKLLEASIPPMHAIHRSYPSLAASRTVSLLFNRPTNSISWRFLHAGIGGLAPPSCAGWCCSEALLNSSKDSARVPAVTQESSSTSLFPATLRPRARMH